MSKRNESFRFRLNSHERRMIKMLAAYFRRNQSDLLRQLIVEAAEAKSAAIPGEEEEVTDQSSSLDLDNSEVQ